jgi:hyperosmotically inducible periplasmic protein
MRMNSMGRGVLVAVTAGFLSAAPLPAVAATSDAWITAKTKMALLTSENVPSMRINVDTVDGRVTLHGTVATADEKAKAEAEARKIEGVKEVRNLLQVVPEAKHDAVKASDSELKDRVAKVLDDDKALDNSDIKVQSVNDGVVLLGGNAKTLSDHLRAVEDARAVPGVRRVRSEVTSPDKLADAEIRRDREPAEAGVKRGVGETASDTWITAATKMRLLANEATPALDINVDTRNGIVTLFGMVPSENAKREAEAEARKVSGVTKVQNELQVVPKAKQEAVEAKDDDVKDSVKQAFEKRDMKGIDIEVKNGVVRLTGTVPDEEDRLAAAITARSVRGVRSVQDDLRVNAERTAR